MNVSPGGLRLERLLKLIPFLQANTGISVPDSADFFGISEEQLISDLNLIWLCGLPGYSHLELIDVSYDSGYISISNAETVARPMKLTSDEGRSLLLAIESIITQVPEKDVKILESLKRKIFDVLQRINIANSGIELDTFSTSEHLLVSHANDAVLPVLVKALQRSEQIIDFQYYSATQDSFLHMEIIPREIYSRNGFTYLLAFSVKSNEYQTFRVDRIHRARLVSNVENGNKFSTNRAKSQSGDIRQKSEEKGATVSVEIKAQALWFIEKWGIKNLVLDQTKESYVGEIFIYDPNWLLRAAISLGGALTVTSPIDMRTRVAKAAESALTRYK